MGISPKRRLLARVADSSGLARLTNAACGWRGLMVLNYHRVGTPGNSPFDHGVWSATAEDFDAHVRFVKRNFDVVGLSDLDDLLNRRTRTRGVMFTFDDGYRDNHDLAYPVLKSHGVPGVFFITTGFLDRRIPAWWDEIAWMLKQSSRSEFRPGPWALDPLIWSNGHRDHVINRLLRFYKSLPGSRTEDFLVYAAEETGSGRCPSEVSDREWMTWDMVRDMVRDGMQIGSHTVTHPVLSRMTDDRIRSELVESKRRLEEVLNVPIDALSYPVGQRDSFDPRCFAALEEAGYRWAFSYYGGFAQDRVPPFDIPRLAVESDCCLPTFRSMTRIPRFVHT